MPILTDKLVKNAEAAPVRREIRDSLLPGLILTVHPTGRKVWCVRFRLRGQACKYTLGPYPVLSLAEAREAGRGALQMVAAGVNPAALGDDAPADKFEDVLEDFLKRHAAGLRTSKETRRALEYDVLPLWRGKRIQDIGRRDVIDLVRGIADRGAPRQANIVFAKVRKLFKWAVANAIVDASPCTDLNPKAQENGPRARVLTDAEIRKFWKATGDLGYPFGPMFRLLLVTGQRLGEVADMRWSELHQDEWLLPKERTKNNRNHAVPLSNLAIAMLSLAPKGAPDHVFTTNSVTSSSGFSKAKARLDEAMGVTDWTLHDLRRTVATGLQACGVAPHITEAILNHKSGTISGVAAIYSRFDYAEEKRAALDLWAERLQTIISAGDI